MQPIVHAAEVRQRFPSLAVESMTWDGITSTPDARVIVRALLQSAVTRLAGAPESEFPEIRAWRAAFAHMGVKPTQHRCASEALLRRLRMTGSLPAVHPLVDVCNAVSAAYAVPIAVFDRDRVAGALTVRPAVGDEPYETFDGRTEFPRTGEIIYADDEGYAHARRWTNRQSRRSGVTVGTERVLIVAEAMHADGERAVAAVKHELHTTLRRMWSQ